MLASKLTPLCHFNYATNGVCGYHGYFPLMSSLAILSMFPSQSLPYPIHLQSSALDPFSLFPFIQPFSFPPSSHFMAVPVTPLLVSFPPHEICPPWLSLHSPSCYPVIFPFSIPIFPFSSLWFHPSVCFSIILYSRLSSLFGLLSPPCHPSVPCYLLPGLLFLSTLLFPIPLCPNWLLFQPWLSPFFSLSIFVSFSPSSSSSSPCSLSTSVFYPFLHWWNGVW